MKKIEFYTYDIFNIDNPIIRQKYFDFCHKTALKCGLVCRCAIDKPFEGLELWGTKYQFIKYYFKTITKNQSKINGIKRVISFLFE